MSQSPNLEFVVTQSIWFEGEAKFADIIFPACTNFERVDISEWAGLGGYGHHGQQQLNHRGIIFQAPAIEPQGESKSDFWIFNERSEEHTSELQSLAYLVCRLLLLKKKKNSTL